MSRAAAITLFCVAAILLPGALAQQKNNTLEGRVGRADEAVTPSGANVTTNATTESASCKVALQNACIMVFPGVSEEACQEQAQDVQQIFVATADPACLWPIPQVCSDMDAVAGDPLDACPQQTVRVVNEYYTQGGLDTALGNNFAFSASGADALALAALLEDSPAESS